MPDGRPESSLSSEPVRAVQEHENDTPARNIVLYYNLAGPVDIVSKSVPCINRTKTHAVITAKILMRLAFITAPRIFEKKSLRTISIAVSRTTGFSRKYKREAEGNNGESIMLGAFSAAAIE